jgi:hypothetical protein
LLLDSQAQVILLLLVLLVDFTVVGGLAVFLAQVPQMLVARVGLVLLLLRSSINESTYFT